LTEHFDVIVVGAGLSGISAAYHLQTQCPDKSFVVLEARAAVGGTWDLFRYPGIRSDSDMHTLGFVFKPWLGRNAIADGASILGYVNEAAREHGIDRKIRFDRRVVRAHWSSRRARWTIDVQSAGAAAANGPRPKDAAGETRLTCNFLFMCSGYFNYGAGYAPHFEGASEFAGPIIHPQHWDARLDYAGKRVIVIGSGATAVTLVPELSKRAAHVVMLQRSPGYLVSLPARDRVAHELRARFSPLTAYTLTRWKNIALGALSYRLIRAAPRLARKLLMNHVRKRLGEDYDVDTHFAPYYDVWDQRLCLVPDGDLFRAIRRGRASVVTDRIDRFTRTGIRLRSGRELEADLIVTATGLEIQLWGGAQLFVDGERVETGRTMNYKGCMLTGVPNFAYTFGYTNASWTLKADLTSQYVCRVLRYLDEHDAYCTPRNEDPSIQEEPWLALTSGFIERARSLLPNQGSKLPFKLYQNYPLDLLLLRYGKIADRSLTLTSKRGVTSPTIATRRAEMNRPN
jgi:monooxygenase